MLDVFIGRFHTEAIAVVTNNAGEVPVGTRFTRLAVVAFSGEGQDTTGREVESRAVDLVVRDISLAPEWKSVHVLPPGWSAGIILEGADLPKVRDLVRTQGNGERVHLRTVGAAEETAE